MKVSDIIITIVLVVVALGIFTTGLERLFGGDRFAAILVAAGAVMGAGAGRYAALAREEFKMSRRNG